MKRIYTLFFLCLFIYGKTPAQQGASIAASIDKTAIVIGEQVQLTLQATFPETATPSFFSIDSIAHFEILNRSKIDTQNRAGGLQLQQTLTLTSFDSGAWQIPAFAVATAKGARTTPFAMQVGFSSPFDPNQPYHEIKDILNVPQKGRETWYWYLVGALLLLLLFLLLFPKKKKAPAENVLDPGAYRQALEKLEKLKKSNPADSKLYFTELIDIFRTYLQQRKGIQSHSKTTEGISAQLHQLKLEEKTFKELVQTLQLSDFVKFAKYNPAPDEREEAVQTIKKSIVAIEHIKE